MAKDAIRLTAGTQKLQDPSGLLIARPLELKKIYIPNYSHCYHLCPIKYIYIYIGDYRGIGWVKIEYPKFGW